MLYYTRKTPAVRTQKQMGLVKESLFLPLEADRTDTAHPADDTTSERTMSLRTFVLVGCIAAASMGLELIQTRILSFLYYNHVVYLTVTIALLGFGISGVFVSLFASRFENPEKAVSLLAAAFSISLFACPALVSRIPETVRGSTTGKLIL